MIREVGVLCALLTLESAAQTVPQVREAVNRGAFDRAEAIVEESRAQHGVTPELAEAWSWMARGALARHDLDRADRYSAETRKLSIGLIERGGSNSSRSLEIALGASIEVAANVLAERGERAEAIAFLKRELKAWWNTPIRTRIQKNLNLLDLEGKPAPPLEETHWLGPKPPSLAELKGKPVLLFFWAHWCSDCKAQIPALARIRSEFGPRGLAVIGPTQTYGYVARGEEAPPGEEIRYIDEIRKTVYAALGNMPVPLSQENFRNYGASTVPTLVLIDAAGIVRLYHPDQMTYEELAARIRPLLQ